MDRLSTLIIALAVIAACDKKSETGSDNPPSRTNSANVAKKKANTDAFCDIHKTDDSGPLLQIPPVGEVKVKLAPAGSWTWLNVWATWCHPCIDEMPRIRGWRDKLNGAGKHVELAFVSVDETDADLAAFKKDHADAPLSARLADPKVQPQWFQELGLDANPPIPINVFVSPTGHVRCARAGSINETDYAAVEKLLGE